MTSKREDCLSALASLLGTLSGVTVERNVELPTRIPTGGLMILRDGSPGDPEVTLSPLTYHFEHRAELEIYWQGRDGRDAGWDDLAVQVGQLMVENRTLGGRCEWLDVEGAEPSDLYVAGGAGIKAGTVNLVLHYSTANPLI